MLGLGSRPGRGWADSLSYEAFSQEAEEIAGELRATLDGLRELSVPPLYHRSHLQLAHVSHYSEVGLMGLWEYKDAEEEQMKVLWLEMAAGGLIRARHLRPELITRRPR